MQLEEEQIQKAKEKRLKALQQNKSSFKDSSLSKIQKLSKKDRALLESLTPQER